MRESHERRARANLERSIARLEPNFRLARDVAMPLLGLALIVVVPVAFALALTGVVLLLYFLIWL
jgi:hypothetical protein